MASTQNSTLRARQPSPRRARSRRRPLPNCTALTANSRVRGPQAVSKVASGSGPARLASITCTPRSANASHTTRLEGNSSSLITTWSPAAQSSPKATSDSPSEVFFTKAISPGEGAWISRASRARRRRSVASQDGYSLAPRQTLSRAKRATASAARRGQGAMAAWFR